MGAALDAVGDVGTALKQGPLLIVAAAIAGIILLLGALITFVPLVGQIVYSIIVVPLVLVGLVAMANAAIDDRAGLDEFTDGIGEYGSDAIGAYAILFVIQFAAVFALLVVALVAGIGVFSAIGAAGSGDPGSGLDAVAGGGLLVFGVILVVGFLVTLLLGLVQNFLDVAVVIGGHGGTDAVRESAALVRDGPLSTIGYLLVRAAVTLVAGILPLALFGLGVALPASGGDSGALAGAGIVFFLLGALALPFPFAASFAYHAGYYRRRRDVSSREDAGASSGNERRSSRDADPMGD
ncbi:hypothetical protein [Natronomonas marina]|jgi:hypothetical protein|uniref:DUF7847 domain-containing protein n=1 Tax=Natronomonas marina TaxID=2961939 RepID=UPI0020C97287|nr:hypothetical protein [Natronomonas marina]